MLARNFDYEILTPAGWKDFNGIMLTGHKKTTKITLVNGLEVNATSNHKFYINDNEVEVKDLNVADSIDTTSGPIEILSIKENGESDVYDVIEVDEKNHKFIVNHCFITRNCDEFSFVRPAVAEDFWTAISPTLATGGKCIITSTPNSDEDKFAEIWYSALKTIDEFGNDIPDGFGINGFRAFTVHYSEKPGYDEAWAAKERNKIGSDKFDREYGLQFLTADSTLINAVTLLKLQGSDPIFKTNEIRWYDKIYPNKTYLVALDPSAGVGKDAAAIEVFSLPDMKQVAEWTHNRTSIPNQVKIMQNIINFIYAEMRKFPEQKGDVDIYFTLENNSWGEAALQVVNDIGEERFSATMMHEPRVRGVSSRRKGLNTNGRTKSMACTKLKSLLESTKLTVTSRMLVRQLKFFVSKGDSFAAKSGENDDCVMATLLCIRMMQMVTRWDESVSHLLRDDFGDDQDTHEDPMPVSFSF